MPANPKGVTGRKGTGGGGDENFEKWIGGFLFDGWSESEVCDAGEGGSVFRRVADLNGVNTKFRPEKSAGPREIECGKTDRAAKFFPFVNNSLRKVGVSEQMVDRLDFAIF